MKKRVYDDDDGRTIADMSGVSRQPLLFPRPQRRRPPVTADIPNGKSSPQIELTKEERRWYALGAMKAALLIALAFIIGLGIVVLLFIL